MQEEIWKETKYSGYFISNYGRLRGRSGRIIKSYLNKRMGYYMICIHLDGRNGKSKCLKIHRLVAEAFISNPNNYNVVNHKDGNKQNNYVENLEWCTMAHNVKHAYKIGLNKALSGSTNPFAKLTGAQIRYIKEKYIPRDKNFGVRALGKMFNVSHCTIIRILKGKRYKYD